MRSLNDKRTRDEEQLFVAEGIKLVEEILGSTLHIRRIYTTRTDLRGANVECVDKRDMERISMLKTPSDTLAIVEQPRNKFTLKRLANRLSIALDEVQNPGNLGTIIRLADWFGIEDVICSKECADIFNPKVVQATMGALLRVRVHYVDNLSEVLRSAAELDLPIYGTLLDGNNIYTEKLATRGIIVMGNEGRGVSEECRNALTHKLFIPPYPANRPTSESLNVAMATGIILAEFRRPK